jgi:hypothetical protein
MAPTCFRYLALRTWRKEGDSYGCLSMTIQTETAVLMTYVPLSCYNNILFMCSQTVTAANHMLKNNLLILIQPADIDATSSCAVAPTLQSFLYCKLQSLFRSSNDVPFLPWVCMAECISNLTSSSDRSL